MCIRDRLHRPAHGHAAASGDSEATSDAASDGGGGSDEKVSASAAAGVREAQTLATASAQGWREPGI